MIVTVHGGHAAQGKAYCGAVGLLDESKEDRLIKDSIIKYLKQGGAVVYDCTVDSGTSQSNVLSQICAKCNEVSADINISIHLNSGRNDSAGDGKQGGFECYATAYSGIKKETADRIVSKMSESGFTMHGNPLKTNSSLYFLNKTKQPSLLLEICFVDDRDDYNQYTKVGYNAIGKAIAEGILNKSIEEKKVANVVQKPLDGSDKQKWKIENIGNGRYMFQNKHNGEYLDVCGGLGKEGDNVQTWPKNTAAAQQWELKQFSGYTPSGCAPFEFITATNGNMRLDVYGASKEASANLQIWGRNKGPAQKFTIIDAGDGYCCIVNNNSLKAVSV